MHITDTGSPTLCVYPRSVCTVRRPEAMRPSVWRWCRQPESTWHRPSRSKERKRRSFLGRNPIWEGQCSLDQCNRVLSSFLPNCCHGTSDLRGPFETPQSSRMCVGNRGQGMGLGCTPAPNALHRNTASVRASISGRLSPARVGRYARGHGSIGELSFIPSITHGDGRVTLRPVSDNPIIMGDAHLSSYVLRARYECLTQ